MSTRDRAARWVFEGIWGGLVVLVAVLMSVPGRKKRAQARAEPAAMWEAALEEWDYDRTISKSGDPPASSVDPGAHEGMVPVSGQEHYGRVDVARGESWTIDDIRREFERYCNLVNASDRASSTKTTYIQHADRFVRWLAGEIEI